MSATRLAHGALVPNARPVHARRLANEVERIRDAGTEVLTFQPTPGDVAAMGRNPMDAGRRAATTEAALASAGARLAAPESQSLAAIQAFIDRHATAPIDEVFRRQLELEMVPGWLRRTILQWNVRSASRKRPGRIGTFSMSSLAGFQAGNHFHPTLCTTSLCQGPLDDAGRCRVTVIADHRVLDGASVARALERLEAVLCQDITAELRRPPAGTRGRREAAA